MKCFCLCCLFLSQFNWLLWRVFKVLKISFWTFWRKNCIPLNLWALFIRKLCKAFRTAQCKQPRLVKPCLNSDVYVIFQTFGTALLETTVSYKPLCSISQENRANPSPSASKHINNSLNLYLFFNFEEKNSIMNGLEYKLKGLLKAIFCHQKSNEKADRFCMKLSSTSNTSAERCLYPIFHNERTHFLLSPYFRKISHLQGSRKLSIRPERFLKINFFPSRNRSGGLLWSIKNDQN